MALSDKLRQRKLAKKTAKRCEQLVGRGHAGVSATSFKVQSATYAARYPVHQCLVMEGLFETGIGNVILSRMLPNGNIGFAAYLVDVWCLGVKNAFYRVMPPTIYTQQINSFRKIKPLVPIAPACLRRLVEGAVAYAQGLGLDPHPDYLEAAPLLGDIDASACTTVFTYGKDSKPLYASGPHDSPKRIRQILALLELTCGKGEYHYLIRIESSDGLVPEED
jgi:hypothetical protein